MLAREPPRSRHPNNRWQHWKENPNFQVRAIAHGIHKIVGSIGKKTTSFVSSCYRWERWQCWQE